MRIEPVMDYDAIVIGDGIAGLGAALGLARYRKKILVLGKTGLEGGSTARAAGILDPFLEMNPGSPLFKFAREAFFGYPRWIRSLDLSLEEAGCKTYGMIYIAMNGREETALRRRLAWQKKTGIPVRWLSGREIFKREPQVSRSARGGLFYPSIPRVQPEKLMKALRVSAKKKGIRMIQTRFSAVCQLSQNHVTGVRAGNRFFKSKIVIQAAGAWAGVSAGAGTPLPVKPVRGQILIVKKGKMEISSILHSVDGGYLVPWDPATFLLGSTVERAGFKPGTTAKGLRSIRRRTEKIVPGLKTARLVTSWAGLRPFPKDRLPIIGEAEIRGLYQAAGYYRSGILISGLAGGLLAQGIVTGRMPRRLKPFSPNRL